MAKYIKNNAMRKEGKSMKKVALILLALVMLLSGSALADDYPLPEGFVYQDYHDYSQYPIVTDGSVTISVGRLRNSSYGIDAKDTWFWTWNQQASGIKMDFVEVLDTAISERKTLMFAGDELPDVMIQFGFTTDELVRYGTNEGQLLALNDYITPDIMPNFYAWCEAYPEILSAITAADGNIYTLPMISGLKLANGIATEIFFIKKDVMEEVGFDFPQTLDEFTAMLYAMKKAYPDSYPFGGAANTSADPRVYILNALGFLTSESNFYGSQVAIKNGKAVIPAYHDDFLEYLTVLNQYYTDGIMPDDFFIMDLTAANAQVAEGKTFTFAYWPNVAVPEVEEFQKWYSGYPLTSDVNDTKQWLAVTTTSIGGFAVSAKTKYAEEIMRWIDFYFSSLGGIYEWGGPLMGSPDTLGMISGCYPNDDGSITYHLPGDGYENNYSYFTGLFGGTVAFGNRSHDLATEAEGCVTPQQYIAWQKNGFIEPFVWDMNNGDNFARSTMDNTVKPYDVEGFPKIVYFDEETADRVNDLKTVLDSYIETEVAKFITGKRDLSEFDAFRAELEKLGIQEFQGIYSDYYDNFLANKAK